jgi:hypothetical protein
MVRRIKKILAPRGRQAQSGVAFRERYEEAERRRAAILQRLGGLDNKARSHPAYRRAMTLLNQTFRKASVAQRIATLQAAEYYSCEAASSPSPNFY